MAGLAGACSEFSRGGADEAIAGDEKKPKTPQKNCVLGFFWFRESQQSQTVFYDARNPISFFWKKESLMVCQAEA